MATRYSPKAVTDGLVFAYDLGNPKSYKGEPSTNLGPTSFASWRTEGSAERIATGRTYKGQPTFNCRTETSASYRGIDTTISGLRDAAGSGGTVTMSCMVKNNNAYAVSMYAFIGHDFASTRTIAANSDWQRVQWTVNQSSMGSDYVEFRPYTNRTNTYLEMTMPMVEVNKGHATPFTTTSRSVTDGLLDLTKNSTINLTNVSFDEDAQMTFDGTDDWINLGQVNPLLNYKSVSAEFVLDVATSLDSNDRKIFHYSKAGTTNGVFQVRKGSNNSQLMYQYNSGGTWYTLTIAGAIEAADQYYHFVFVHSGNKVEAYRNGVLLTSGTFSANLDWADADELYIGYRAASEYWKGNIDIAKFYNRALSADEVQQNYNAIRGRFGI